MARCAKSRHAPFMLEGVGGCRMGSAAAKSPPIRGGTERPCTWHLAGAVQLRIWTEADAMYLLLVCRADQLRACRSDPAYEEEIDDCGTPSMPTRRGDEQMPPGRPMLLKLAALEQLTGRSSLSGADSLLIGPPYLRSWRVRSIRHSKLVFSGRSSSGSPQALLVLATQVAAVGRPSFAHS